MLTTTSSFKTIGYGDIKVQKTSTKIFLIFYLLVSTISLAVAFGNFLSHWDNREQHLLKKEIILNNVDFEEIIVNCCYDGVAEWPDGTDTHSGRCLSHFICYITHTVHNNVLYICVVERNNESSDESKSNILISPLVRPAKQRQCQVNVSMIQG